MTLPLFLLEAFVVGGTFGFVGGTDAAGEGFAGGEAAAADFAFFFQLLFRGGGKTRPGNGLEAGGFDGFARQFARAVGAAANALKRLVDFIDGVLFRRKTAESEI